MRSDRRVRAVSGSIAAPPVSSDRAESGQIMVSLLLMLAIFLLLMVGFAVDLTNLWFHRQAAQTAADSACQAGAMDMLMVAVGTTMPNMGFTPGTPGDCTAGTGTICFYANANGYNGAGFSAGSVSNSVSWSFPSAVPSVTAPSSSLTAYPFLKVVVSENVKTHFLYTIHGTSYQLYLWGDRHGAASRADPGAESNHSRSTPLERRRAYRDCRGPQQQHSGELFRRWST
jgi:Flp pilus assembly protein TadG